MNKADSRLFLLACVLILAIGAWIGHAADLAAARLDASHNAAGGYVDACGELPGLIGDDC